MQSRSTQKKIHISVLLQTNTATKTKSGGNPPGRNNIFMTMSGEWGVPVPHPTPDPDSVPPAPYPCQKPITDNAQKDFYFSRFQCSQFFHPFRLFSPFFVKLSEKLVRWPAGGGGDGGGGLGVGVGGPCRGISLCIFQCFRWRNLTCVFVAALGYAFLMCICAFVSKCRMAHRKEIHPAAQLSHPISS